MGKLGMPKIVIEFSKKAGSAIERSSRGTVLLLLNDATKQEVVTAYSSLGYVDKSHWTDKNYKYLKYAFKGKPGKVICVRAVKTETKVDIVKSILLFKNLQFDYFAFPECSSEDAAALSSFFDTEKKTNYNRAKAVLPNMAGDSPAVINFAASGISVVWDDAEEAESVSTAEYTARIAGILAGIPLTQSSTSYVLDEVVDIKQPEDPDAEIGAGKLILVFDGERFKIGRGVTSLQTVTEICPEDWKKIKLVEATDLIRSDIKDTYQESYVGKKNNSYANRQQFVGAVNTYLKELEGSLIDADEDHEVSVDAVWISRYLVKNGFKTQDEVDTMSEIQLKKSNTGSMVAICGKCKLLDAMEDLTLSMTL